MTTAYLGLGGNIGDVHAALKAALDGLDNHLSISVTAVSPLYKTPPWGLKNQPWFLNCCVAVETDLSPEDLLAACQGVERAGKRERHERWGPRTIDVDILVYEGVSRKTDTLTLPHPSMTERAFVMVPLADIAPAVMVEDRSVLQWASKLDDEGMVVAEGSTWWTPSR